MVLVVYLVYDDDLDIQRPITRTLLFPFVNPEDHHDYVLYGNYEVYGQNSTLFTDKVKSLVRLFNRGKADGLYCGVENRGYYGKNRTVNKIKNDVDIA